MGWRGWCGEGMPVLMAMAAVILPLPVLGWGSEAKPGAEPIALPVPRTEGGESLARVLATRRSLRSFRDQALTLAAVGQLLWAGQGVTDRRGLRTAPSAGALYPLELYLVAGAVEGLPPGVYRYLPLEHALVLTGAGDRRRVLAEAALGQGMLRAAPATIAITAVYERTTGKYRDRGRRYAHIEVGHAAQNIGLQAVALDLGTVPVGAFDDAAVRETLGATAAEQPLYLLPVGQGQGE